MTPTDEARAALLSYGEQLNASDRTWFKNDVDALIAAVRAEGGLRTDERLAIYKNGWDDGRAESTQELAALREAADEYYERMLNEQDAAGGCR